MRTAYSNLPVAVYSEDCANQHTQPNRPLSVRDRLLQ